MENFYYLNKFVYPCNAQKTIFIIQLCVVFELFVAEVKTSFPPQLHDITVGSDLGSGYY